MNNSAIRASSMKRTRQFLTFLALSLLLGASGVALRLPSVAQPPPAFSPSKTSDPTNQIAALRAEIDQLKGKVPDQSHAMSDVGYHFANLWFAGEKKNWPLAKFYLDETRSHLNWAVRIIPVRKTRAGDLELKGILDAIDNTFLSEIANSSGPLVPRLRRSPAAGASLDGVNVASLALMSEVTWQLGRVAVCGWLTAALAFHFRNQL